MAGIDDDFDGIIDYVETVYREQLERSRLRGDKLDEFQSQCKERYLTRKEVEDKGIEQTVTTHENMGFGKVYSKMDSRICVSDRREIAKDKRLQRLYAYMLSHKKPRGLTSDEINKDFIMYHGCNVTTVHMKKDYRIIITTATKKKIILMQYTIERSTLLGFTVAYVSGENSVIVDFEFFYPEGRKIPDPMTLPFVRSLSGYK